MVFNSTYQNDFYPKQTHRSKVKTAKGETDNKDNVIDHSEQEYRSHATAVIIVYVINYYQSYYIAN